MLHRRHTRRLLSVACVAGAAWFAAISFAQAEGPWLARMDYGQGRRVTTPVPPREIALQTGNTLQGTVVDDEGMPQANYEVWIAQDGATALKTRTDASGRFSVPAVPPGLYTIDTPSGGGKYRLWEEKDAPRDAQSNVLLVICVKANG